MKYAQDSHRREDFLIAMVGGATILYGTTLVVAAVLFALHYWPALVRVMQF